MAITDTDLTERKALAEVFPNIWLLICKFHLRQSWRNHRKKVMKGTSPLSMQPKARLEAVEDDLVASTSHDAALALIADELKVLDLSKESVDAEGRAVIEKAETHLGEYLRDWWCRVELWQSWSNFGRGVAATRLGVAVEGVLPTTNHLESFNNVFKHGHLGRFRRGRPQLRIETLLITLLARSLPCAIMSAKSGGRYIGVASQKELNRFNFDWPKINSRRAPAGRAAPCTSRRGSYKPLLCSMYSILCEIPCLPTRCHGGVSGKKNTEFSSLRHTGEIPEARRPPLIAFALAA